MDPLAIRIPSLEKCLFQILSPVFNWTAWGLLFIFDVELCVFHMCWILKPIFTSMICKYVSHLLCCLSSC